jgi:HD-GYP domain-containing protein (c-di-GMP phosphodiesterase class II)
MKEIDSVIKEKKGFEDIKKIFSDTLIFTEKIFTNFVTMNDLPIRPISDKLKELIDVIKSKKRFILRLTEMEASNQNYIVAHSVKTTILCITIGLHLKLPTHKLIDLGMAALLHEIGMIKLPPQLYMSNKVLSLQEKKAITAHVVLGYKILKTFSFPMSVCLAVLEHHEHMDGTGYPRNLTNEKISTNARIITICDAYAALISKRPYRGAKDGHSSILDLLKDRGKRYDENLVRTLVFNLSIFPIGTFVALQNGSKGKVFETNEENPKSPAVLILIDSSGRAINDHMIVQTDEQENRILRPLTPEEITALNLPD